VRVLLDEQLPRHLAREVRGHDVSTVQEKGWAGLKNGELLLCAEDAGFEVFVTAGIPAKSSQTRLGVVLLVAPSNALEDLLPLVPGLLTAIPKTAAGKLVRVEV
jgi:hypothetical protein